MSGYEDRSPKLPNGETNWDAVWSGLGFGGPGTSVHRFRVSEGHHMIGIATDLPIGTYVKEITDLVTGKVTVELS